MKKTCARIIPVFLLSIISFQKVYSQCTPISTAGKHCDGQRAIFPMPTTSGPDERIEWYQDAAGTISDGTLTDASGNHISRLDVQTGQTSKDYWAQRKTKSSIGGPPTPPAAGTNSMQVSRFNSITNPANSKYEMQLTPAVDFTLNSIKVWVKAYQPSQVYGLRVRVVLASEAADDTKGTYSDWAKFGGSGNPINATIPTNIEVKAGGPYLVQIISFTDAAAGVTQVEEMYYRSTPNDVSYLSAPNNIDLKSIAKYADNSTTNTSYPDMNSWGITVNCPLTKVTSTLTSTGCCVPVKDIKLTAPSTGTFPKTITVQGNDATSTNYYEWYDEKGLIITSNSGVGKTTLQVGKEGSYRVKVVQRQADLDKISCYKESPIILGTPPVTVDAKKISACKGDSIRLQATTDGLFHGWSTLDGETDNITNPSDLTTWVTPKDTTTYVAKVSYQLGNLIKNHDFEGSGGFTSSYGYVPNTIPREGFYGIGTNPKPFNTSWFVDLKDHTTGNGKMLVVDGDLENTSAAYRATVPVEAGVTYAFSFWIANVHTEFAKPKPDTNGTQPSKVQFVIDDQPLIKVNTLPDNNWRQYVQIYTATKTGDVDILLRNNANISPKGGNDFALDDVVFAPLSPTYLTDTVFVRPCLPPCLKAGTIDSSQTICKDGTTLPKKLNSLTPANGGAPGATIQYQWESSADGTTWTPIPGATGIDYTPTQAPTADIFYRRAAKTGPSACENAVTTPVKITVINPPVAELILPQVLISTTPPATYSLTTRNPNIWLEAKAPLAGYKGTWVLTNAKAPGLKGGDLNTLKDSLLLQNFDQTTKAEWTVQDVKAKCPVTKVTVEVTRKNVTTPNAGPDARICITQVPTYKLTGNDFTTGDETAEWKLVSSVPTGAIVTQVGTTKEATFTVPGAGTYIFSYTINNIALNRVLSDSVEIKVDAEVVKPTLTKPSPIDICVDQINLPANPAEPNPTAVGTWKFDKSQPITTQVIASPNSPTSLLRNIPSPSVTKLFWVVENGVCPKDSVPLTINQKGTISPATISLNGTIISGTDTAICLGTNNTLLASSPSTDPAKGETGSWTPAPVGTSVTIAGGNTPSQPMTLNGEGSTKVTWTISSTLPGCTPATKEVTIKVSNKPVLQPIVGDIDLCEGDEAIYFARSKTTPGIDTLPITTYTWSIKPSAPATGVAALQGAGDKGSAKFKFTSPATTGATDKAIISVTATNICGTSDPVDQEVTLNLKPRDFTGIIDGTDTICYSSTASETYQVSIQPNATNYIWKLGTQPGVSQTSNSFTYPASQITSQVPANATQLTPVPLTVTLINGCGEGVSKNLNIYVQPAVPVIAQLKGDSLVCIPRETITYTGYSPNGGLNPLYAFEVRRNNVPTSTVQPASTNRFFTISPNVLKDGDVIRLTVTGDPLSGCFAGGGTPFDHPIEGYEYPDTSVTSNLPNIICEGPEITLCVKENKNNQTFQWRKNGLSIPGQTANCISLTSNSQSGAYSVKISNKGCDSLNSLPKIIRIIGQPKVEFIPNDVQIELLETSSTNLHAEVTKVPLDSLTKVTWFTRDLLSNFSTDSLNATFTAPSGGIYTYTIQVETGGGFCTDTAHVVVRVFTPVIPPNAFSPNGDGLNDTWHIQGIEPYPKAKVAIFNRWGSKLYDVSPYGKQNEWDGKNNGAELPIGTYYYTIDLNEELTKQSRTMAGSLTIVR